MTSRGKTYKISDFLVTDIQLWEQDETNPFFFNDASNNPQDGAEGVSQRHAGANAYTSNTKDLGGGAMLGRFGGTAGFIKWKAYMQHWRRPTSPRPERPLLRTCLPQEGLRNLKTVFSTQAGALRPVFFMDTPIPNRRGKGCFPHPNYEPFMTTLRPLSLILTLTAALALTGCKGKEEAAAPTSALAPDAGFQGRGDGAAGKEAVRGVR
jgi:hypothetical protein